MTKLLLIGYQIWRHLLWEVFVWSFSILSEINEMLEIRNFLWQICHILTFSRGRISNFRWKSFVCPVSTKANDFKIERPGIKSQRHLLCFIEIYLF